MYRKILTEKWKKTEEMHKKICISSFLFCSFALIYRLGIFVLEKKWGFFIVNIAGNKFQKNPAICTKLYY